MINSTATREFYLQDHTGVSFEQLVFLNSGHPTSKEGGTSELNGFANGCCEASNSEINKLHEQLLLRTSSSFLVQMTSDKEKLKAGTSRA